MLPQLFWTWLAKVNVQKKTSGHYQFMSFSIGLFRFTGDNLTTSL